MQPVAFAFFFFMSKKPEINLFGQLKSKWVFVDKIKFDQLTVMALVRVVQTKLNKHGISSRYQNILPATIP